MLNISATLDSQNPEEKIPKGDIGFIINVKQSPSVVFLLRLMCEIYLEQKKSFLYFPF